MEFEKGYITLYHPIYVTAIAILHPHKINPSRIVSGSYNNTLKIELENPRNGTCDLTLRGHTDFVKAILPDGRIVSGSEDKTIIIWS